MACENVLPAEAGQNVRKEAIMKILLRTDNIVALVLCACIAGPVAASEYPSKPITLINPMPPGGTLDVQARAWASVAEKYLGQPVAVVNKPGATGMIGAVAGAQAPPDGYTLTVASVNFTNAVEWELANGRTPPFSYDDFAYIGAFTMSPTLVLVPYDSPYNSVQDLIAIAKARPGQLAYCSGGLYGMSHLPIELFAKATGLSLRHVPYKGGGPCLSAVVGKHVDFAFQYPPNSLPLVRGNKLKVLAVAGARRVKSIPDVPSFKDLGIDAEYYGWVGIAAPQKTPRDIVEKLREVTKKIAGDKSFKNMIEHPGDEVVYLHADDVRKHIEKESKTIAEVHKELAKAAAKR
jgi:tripartite-type tricarboxylate transporter receptor subunit TctC